MVVKVFKTITFSLICQSTSIGQNKCTRTCTCAHVQTLVVDRSLNSEIWNTEVT